MLKYVFGFLAGVAAMLLTLLVMLMIWREIYPHKQFQTGMLENAIIFAAACGAARYVFVLCRKREPDKEPSHETAPSLAKSDHKNFQKILSMSEIHPMGIREFRVAEKEGEGIGFVIGLRTEAGKTVDTELLTQAMHRVYYKHITFEYVDLESERGQQFLAKSIEVKIQEAKKS